MRFCNDFIIMFKIFLGYYYLIRVYFLNVLKNIMERVWKNGKKRISLMVFVKYFRDLL